MKKFLMALCVLACGVAAAAEYDIFDPAVTFVNVNYNNNTTIVQLNGVYYRGPSAYYVIPGCTKPNSTYYRCAVYEEDNVVLTATDNSGATISVSIVYQHTSTLNRSGHNYWVPRTTILSGTITTP